jgi:hypothetical protein
LPRLAIQITIKSESIYICIAKYLLMVSIITKEVKGNEYFFLVHSYREGGRVKQIQKSLGKNIPENLDEIKEEFMAEVVSKLWIPAIDSDKKNSRSREG